MTMHVMNIPDFTGHNRIQWQPDNAAQVAIARAAFNAAREQGQHAFRVNPDDPDEPGTRMTSFDPEAAEIIFAPQLRGG